MFKINQIAAASRKLIDAEVFALEQVSRLVNSDKYFEFVMSLYNVIAAGEWYSRRIIVTGVGKNANIATKISESMASLGIPSFYLNTSHAPHGDYGFIGPNDAIIHISRSGTTTEMVLMIQYVNQTFPGVKQYLVHCNPSIGEIVPDLHDFCLGRVIEGDDHSLAPTSSTTALLAFLDAVSAALSKLIGFERMEFLKLHPAGALGAMLAAEKDKPAAT
jgi:arabinose-5-phosphate isomerase